MQFFLTLLGIYSNPSQQDFPSIPQYNKAKLPINHRSVKLFIFFPCIVLCSSFSFVSLPLFIVPSAHTILILTHLLPSSGICYVCLDLEVCSVICLMGLLGHPRWLVLSSSFPVVRSLFLKGLWFYYYSFIAICLWDFCFFEGGLGCFRLYDLLIFGFWSVVVGC